MPDLTDHRKSPAVTGTTIEEGVADALEAELAAELGDDIKMVETAEDLSGLDD